MKNLQHGGQPYQTRVVGEFNAGDMGAPFDIVLVDAVKETFEPHTGEQISYTIPDPDGLIRAVIFARILHPRKLSGAEIKWLRKAAGVMQKAIASAISMTAEHLSRCEAGALVMSPASEKLLRLYLFRTAIKHHQIRECEAKQRLEMALDKLFEIMEPVSAYDVAESLAFYFYRRPCEDKGIGNDNNDDDDAGWDDFKRVVNL